MRVQKRAVQQHARKPGLLASAIAKGESGQTFVAVLILLVVGGLMLPPLLGLVDTSAMTEDVRESILHEFYTADSGVEDALWQIKADELATLFPDYDRYAFSAYDGTDYRYSDYVGTASAPDLNRKDLDITIENVWVPEGINAPSPTEAQQIIDDGKLVVTGSIPDGDTYRIRITYNHEEVTDPDWDELEIDEIGVWLPPGTSYVTGSSNLESNPMDDYYCVPTTQDYKSGVAITWDFSPNILFSDLPGVSVGSYPLVASIEFDFSSSSGRTPDAAVAWATTTGVTDVDYAWDADVRVFKIESEATDPTTGSSITAEAYTAKGQIRRISAAIAGDYYATGNSLLTSTDYNDNYLDRLHKESSATIPSDDTGANGVPTQGIPEAVYLYWTGWIDWHDYDPTGEETIIFFDPCTRWQWGGNDFDNWNAGSSWGLSGSYTAFWAAGGSGSSTVLTLDDGIDLTAYSDETVTVSWRVWRGDDLESGDCFEFQLSGDDGSTWGDLAGNEGAYETAFCDDGTFGSSPGTGRRFSYIVPASYITDEFKIRFRSNFSSSSRDYVYFDEFTIASQDTASGGSLRYPDTPTAENLRALIEDTARTNTVLVDAGASTAVEITADSWEIEPTTDIGSQTTYQDTWSYCCFADITDQVRQWIEDGYLNNNAAGTYTLGHKVATNAVDPSFSFDLYVPSAPDGETGYPLGTPAYGASNPPAASRHNYSHAGWSIIVIYTSPETEGHQLYLFDIQDPEFDFTEAWYTNPDFDGDGDPGGRVSGFLVPEPVGDEEICAKLTAFVGEGDSLISGDQLEVNGRNLSNTWSPATNVWNSASSGATEDGIDIDTFVIEWDDNILETGDSSATIDMDTDSDGFNIVYLILSFRSDVTTGGTISFLLSG